MNRMHRSGPGTNRVKIVECKRSRKLEALPGVPMADDQSIVTSCTKKSVQDKDTEKDGRGHEAPCRVAAPQDRGCGLVGWPFTLASLILAVHGTFVFIQTLAIVTLILSSCFFFLGGTLFFHLKKAFPTIYTRHDSGAGT